MSVWWVWFYQTDIRDQWVIKIIDKYKAIKSHNTKSVVPFCGFVYWNVLNSHYTL